jgi:hypothetical protein
MKAALHLKIKAAVSRACEAALYTTAFSFLDAM